MKLPHFPVTITAITKNEGPFVAEWVAYHYLLGVEQFLIYDNASTDDTVEVLAPFINAGIVTLVHWPYFPGQIEAYQHAIMTFGPRCDWMGFLDLDEFVSLPPDVTLPQFLATLPPEAEELVLFWRLFGHSGHRARPAGLLIEEFTACEEAISQISKCFVRPGAINVMHVHHAATARRFSVNEFGRQVPQVWMHEKQNVSGEQARINHYFTRSYDDYLVKLARGQADGRSEKKLEPFETWDFPYRDERVAAYAPRVRALLDLIARRGAAGNSYGNMALTGLLAATRRFTVPATASINKAHKTFADPKAVKLFHTHHGTGLIAPVEAMPDADQGALFHDICNAVRDAVALTLPHDGGALPPPTGEPVDAASLWATIWIAVTGDVSAPGPADFVLTGLRRDGTRIRQLQRIHLVQPGRYLALLLLSDEPVLPEAVEVSPLASGASFTVHELRTFAAQ